MVDFIEVRKSIIPPLVCQNVISEAEKREWRPHKWYSYGEDEFSVDAQKNHYIQNTDPNIQGFLNPYICQSLNDYAAKNIFSCPKIDGITSKFSNVVLNRYSSGHMLDQHQDHINALFDGREKGIPILSMIINLNDDYDGGEFAFFDRKLKHKIKKGSAIVFPSNFMYPHEILPVTKGTRYSIITWFT